jgi:hypothetical protein
MIIGPCVIGKHDIFAGVVGVSARFVGTSFRRPPAE